MRGDSDSLFIFFFLAGADSVYFQVVCHLYVLFGISVSTSSLLVFFLTIFDNLYIVVVVVVDALLEPCFVSGLHCNSASRECTQMHKEYQITLKGQKLIHILD